MGVLRIGHGSHQRKKAYIKRTTLYLLILLVIAGCLTWALPPESTTGLVRVSHYTDEERSKLPAVEYVEPNEALLFGPYDVDFVPDGDTVRIINGAGKPEIIRYIGTDAPDCDNPDKSQNSDEGSIASGYAKILLRDKQVWLEYDEDIHDDANNILAYVYIKKDDKLTMVQDVLLYEGIARTMPLQPNTKYAEHFAEIQVNARIYERGFWGNMSDLFAF